MDDKIPEIVIRIVEHHNLKYHVYNAHPEWVESWKFITGEFPNLLL